jgi:carbamoyltransferase
MYILGINISHDSSSCLLKDGEIVFYREDERVSKLKHNSFVYQRPYPFTYYHIDDIKKHTTSIDHIFFASFGDPSYDRKIIYYVLDQLKDAGIKWEQVIFNENEHHFYHASAAAFCSGFEECACLIIDGSGAYPEWDEIPFREIESIYSFNISSGFDKKFKHYSRLAKSNYHEFNVIKENDTTIAFSDSMGCGSLFSEFAFHLGYNSGYEAGKIMGLSSYGTYTDQYGKWFSYLEGVGITNTNLLYPLLNRIKFKSDKEQQDILKTLQEETKSHTIYLIKKALEVCNTNNIVLSGGYFLNCVNNYQYLKEFPEINFYVDPMSHDGGTAIGAAKYLWWDLTKDQTIRKLDTLYLG